jgi:Na+/H+ antiporter NhaD/arsenite permease-like protein
VRLSRLSGPTSRSDRFSRAPARPCSRSKIVALLHLLHDAVPLARSLVGALLRGRRLREIDFSIVAVFALLFVGVAGLERGRLYQLLNPERIFGHRARGLVVSGAVPSQLVSNAPASILLVPTVGAWPGLRGLLYGVNAGGCGTPVSSIANLIGAQLFLRDGGSAREFWRAFWPISLALLVAMTAVSLFLVSI